MYKYYARLEKAAAPLTRERLPVSIDVIICATFFFSEELLMESQNLCSQLESVMHDTMKDQDQSFMVTTSITLNHKHSFGRSAGQARLRKGCKNRSLSSAILIISICSVLHISFPKQKGDKYYKRLSVIHYMKQLLLFK